MYTHVYDLLLIFENGFSGKGKIKSLWGEKIKSLMDGIPQGQQRTQEMRYYKFLVQGHKEEGGEGAEVSSK